MGSFFTSVKTKSAATWRYVLAHKVWSGIIVIVVLGGGYLAYAHYTATPTGTDYVIAPVTRGDLTVTIAGSGQVTANQQLDLSPKSSGEVTSVLVKAGDTVFAGQTIATVDDTDAEKSLRDAELNLQSAQISYQQSTASTQTSLQTSEGDAFNASATAMSDLPGITQDIDSALHDLSKIPDHTFQENADADAAVLASSNGSALAAQAEASYQKARAAYQTAATISAAVSRTSSVDDIDKLTNAVYAAIFATSEAANDAHELISDTNDRLIQNSMTVPSAFTAQLSTISADATKANSDTSSVFSAKTSLENAQATLGGASGPTLDQQTAELSLEKAQNAYQDARDTLADYVVTAPFSGTIAKVNVQTHDQASSGTAVATLITNEVDAELSLNEVDAAKVKVGQKVVLTFDAIDGLTLPGTVAEIDSVGTVTQGVVTYDVKISFDTQDARVKPGMTVNATITTGSATGVLIVPSSAVTTVGGQSYVQVVTADASAPAASGMGTSTRNRFSSTTPTGISSTTPRLASTTGRFASSSGGAAAFARTAPTQTVPIASVTVKRVPVTIGLASDTQTEIVSGLTEGEQIVVRTTTAAAASTAAAGATTRTTAAGSARAGFGGGGNAVFVPKGG